MTPHINAKEDAFSNVVLMPGDPERARYIAQTYLEDYKLVTDVRGMLGYTGIYKGKKLSVMASGMGMPSIGIYAYELYQSYHVDTIIRIGTCGSNDKSIHVFDTVLATKSETMSNFAYQFAHEDIKEVLPTASVNERIKEVSSQLGMPLVLESVYTEDALYKLNNPMKDFKVVEMESFALFYIAEKLHKQAAALFTVSNSFITNEEISSEERQKNLNKMILLALESALTIK